MDNLSPTYYYDYESEAIQNLVAEFRTDELSDIEKAIGLYLKVRDGWWYNPYIISLKKEDYRASWLMERTHGHCIDKAIILIAGLRALGIPARINLAKVKNHIAVDRLTELLGTNELTPHGNVTVFLDGKWVKATPAFNKDLCRMISVEPLEFDGENNSIFQPFNSAGTQFMEYLDDYGDFEDFPFDFVIENMKSNYPRVKELFGEDAEVFDFRKIGSGDS